MKRTQVYLTEEQYRELKLLADNSDKSFSELIREGADLIVKKKKKKAKKSRKGSWDDFIGAYKGKVETNAVEMINDYYKNFGE